jgi:diguanylate cyclase (GGDEF)-like protein
MPPLVSVVVGNVVLSLAYTLELEAIVLFRNLRYQRRILYAALTVEAIVLVAMFVMHASGAAFISATSFYNGSLAVWFVVVMLMRPREQMRSSDVLLVAIEGLFGLVVLSRAVEAMLPTSTTTSLLAETTIQSVFFATVYIASTAAAFAFILMTKQEGDEALMLLATTDPLTGVLNRRAFMERAYAEQARLARIEHPCTVLMMDLDFFKSVNDTYGHAAGDSVLKCFADAAKRSLRSYDILARYGGEEFVALLPHSDVDEAQLIASRILSAIEGATSDVPQRQTVSIGIASAIRDTAMSLDELLRRADHALYQAKQQGRNRVIVFDSAIAV